MILRHWVILRPNRTVYRCKSIGLILLQELTFWGSASRRRVRLVHPFHAAPAIVVQFGAITLSTSPISPLRARRPPSRASRRTVEADFSPVRYLATLIGAADEVVLRWFILVVVLLLGPSAVLLLLAATRTRVVSAKAQDACRKAVERAKPVGWGVKIKK
jgi:hypothetical protein